MLDSKPWYLSKTIWASLVTIITALAGLAGFPVAGVDNGVLTDLLLQTVSAISGLIAVFGRISASAAIE